MPTVVDATAGLGAMPRARLPGCGVTLIERSPVVAALLQDGLTRAGQDPEIGPWVRERMQLLHGAGGGDSAGADRAAGGHLPGSHVPRQAEVGAGEKEMRVFQSPVGRISTRDALLPAAPGWRTSGWW